MEDSDTPKETSNKPNNEVLVLKQLKSIKVALWTLVTVFVILPVIAGIGTGVVIGFIALKGGDSRPEAMSGQKIDISSGSPVLQSAPPPESDTTEVKPSWAAATNSATGSIYSDTVPVEETTDD